MTAIQLMLLTGEWLLYLLAFILAVRPLVKQSRKFSPLFKYRKQMGWAFGALTMLHVAIYLFLYLDSLKFVLTLFDDLWFITGLIATILTIALTATSNKWAMRKLKGKWKILHKATYYIGFLGILHGELASKQQNKGLYVLLVIYALLLLYRYRNGWVLAVTIGMSMIAYGNIWVSTPAPKVVIVEDMDKDSDEWKLCGQFGLSYVSPIEGFYNCELK